MAEYIEREAAKSYACDRCGSQGHCNRPELCPVMSGFDRIPAADVRPVVRGKWEESVDQLQASCSVCKTSFPCWRMWPANFCPNCGADMREES